MFPSLKMKLFILSKFIFVVGAYFSIRVLQYILFLFVDDEVAMEKFECAVQVSDLLTLGGMLWLFRPKIWPQFFTLSINEMMNPVDIGNNQGA